MMTLWGEEEVETKTCSICEETKPVTEFHLCQSKRVINGKRYESTYRSECKVCRGVGGKAHSSQAKKLMDDMGMIRPPIGTPCDCCGKSTDMLVFDHDHETNAFRGWLCYQCNTSIGNLGDNLEGIMRAVKYLEDFFG